MRRSGLMRRRWTRSGRVRIIGRCCQHGNEKGILPVRGYDCVDEGGMDEVDETARRRARERLTADEHVAALLASGDPAAERAALALASTLARGAAPLSASPGPSFTWSGTSRAGCCEEAD